MTREYFAILGRMWSTKGGKALLTGISIFDLFTQISQLQPLDYLSRIIMSNLDYNNPNSNVPGNTGGGKAELVKSQVRAKS
jgi:hypothetical protein